MKTGSLLHADDNRTVVATVRRTTNAWDRLRGLLGRAPLGAGQGLLLDPCASVHTWFMGYALDLVYLDADLTVLRIVEAVAPWRGSLTPGARMTLELAAGGAARAGLMVGTPLRWQAH